MKQTNWIGLACLLSASVVGVTLTSRADEWEKSSPFYEDDAWYDITEWMDGNDYNPVDEQWGKWDDEVYDSDVPSRDRDNDRSYGFSSSNPNDWFYDYWYPTYSYYGSRSPAMATVDSYDRVFRYTDRDGDGSYDSYIGYYDYDNDGDFDRVVSYDFRSSKPGQERVEQVTNGEEWRTVAGFQGAGPEVEWTGVSSECQASPADGQNCEQEDG